MPTGTLYTVTVSATVVLSSANELPHAVTALSLGKSY